MLLEATLDGPIVKSVDCQHCGARYELRAALVSKPKLSEEMIEKIKNVPR